MAERSVLEHSFNQLLSREYVCIYTYIYIYRERERERERETRPPALHSHCTQVSMAHYDCYPVADAYPADGVAAVARSGTRRSPDKVFLPRLQRAWVLQISLAPLEIFKRVFYWLSRFALDQS